MLRWVFSTLIVIFLVIFAVSNLEEVTVNLTPLTPPLSTPLSIIAVGAFLIGCLFGGLMVWLEYGLFSRRADKKRAQVYDLIKENKSLKKRDDTSTSYIPPQLTGQ